MRGTYSTASLIMKLPTCRQGSGAWTWVFKHSNMCTDTRGSFLVMSEGQHIWTPTGKSVQNQTHRRDYCQWKLHKCQLEDLALKSRKDRGSWGHVEVHSAFSSLQKIVRSFAEYRGVRSEMGEERPEIHGARLTLLLSRACSFPSTIPISRVTCTNHSAITLLLPTRL